MNWTRYEADPSATVAKTLAPIPASTLLAMERNLRNRAVQFAGMDQSFAPGARVFAQLADRCRDEAAAR
jgi:hypothetical protein